MKKKKFYDPYAELLNKFNQKGIKYVIVGMSGINYYASNAREMFSTQDFDIFVKPTIENVKKSTSILKKLGYRLSSAEKEIINKDIKDLVKARRTIIGINIYGITIELILAISGYTFSQMEFDASVFNVDNIPIKVGKLKKLLMSKKDAGREKDKLFLKRFEALIKEKENKT